MVSSILPKKNERKNSTLLLWYLRSNCFHSFFGRIEETINCFWDLLTFSVGHYMVKIFVKEHYFYDIYFHMIYRGVNGSWVTYKNAMYIDEIANLERIWPNCVAGNLWKHFLTGSIKSFYMPLTLASIYLRT